MVVCKGPEAPSTPNHLYELEGLSLTSGQRPVCLQESLLYQVITDHLRRSTARDGFRFLRFSWDKELLDAGARVLGYSDPREFSAGDRSEISAFLLGQTSSLTESHAVGAQSWAARLKVWGVSDSDLAVADGGMRCPHEAPQDRDRRVAATYELLQYARRQASSQPHYLAELLAEFRKRQGYDPATHLTRLSVAWVYKKDPSLVPVATGSFSLGGRNLAFVLGLDAPVGIVLNFDACPVAVVSFFAKSYGAPEVVQVQKVPWFEESNRKVRVDDRTRGVLTEVHWEPFMAAITRAELSRAGYDAAWIWNPSPENLPAWPGRCIKPETIAPLYRRFSAGIGAQSCGMGDWFAELIDSPGEKSWRDFCRYGVGRNGIRTALGINI